MMPTISGNLYYFWFDTECIKQLAAGILWKETPYHFYCRLVSGNILEYTHIIPIDNHLIHPDGRNRYEVNRYIFLGVGIPVDKPEDTSRILVPEPVKRLLDINRTGYEEFQAKRKAEKAAAEKYKTLDELIQKMKQTHPTPTPSWIDAYADFDIISKARPSMDFQRDKVNLLPPLYKYTATFLLNAIYSRAKPTV